MRTDLASQGHSTARQCRLSRQFAGALGLFLFVLALLSIPRWCAATTIAINIGTGTGLTGVTQTTYTNVDFDNNSAGDVWNNLKGIGTGTFPLATLDGTAHPTATVRYIDFPEAALPFNNLSPTTAAWNNALDVEHVKVTAGILSSGVYDFSNNKLVTLNIEGLGIGTVWDVEVYAVDSNSAAGDKTVTVNGGTPQQINSDLFFSSSDPDDARAVFLGVPASLADDGTISIDVHSPVTSFLNAVRLTQVPVPEPSSFAMAALAGLALCLGVWRGRRLG